MYLWIKAAHVIGVISWMAGLFYLPRIFVYHSQIGPGQQSETFKVMEKKLLNVIMAPAMIWVWGTGLYLAFAGGYWKEFWFFCKFSLVIGMTLAHFYDAELVRRFAADENRHSHIFYRYINEIPTVLMIGIVIMVVVKPYS